MKLLGGFAKILIVTVTAVSFMVGYTSVSNAQTPGGSEKLAGNYTAITKKAGPSKFVNLQATLTPTPTLSPELKVSLPLNFSSDPIETAIPSPAPPLPNPVQIGFLSVGRGDAILVISPDGKKMLIDGGPHGSGITGTLKKLGITEIDVMVATHPHQDHIGGLIDVLKAFPVGMLYTNGEGLEEDAVYDAFHASVKSAGLKEIAVEFGDMITIGDLTLQVLNPRAKARPDVNENSMVLSFSYLGTTVLLMSDADHVTENDLLKTDVDVNADILKLGHHGSSESSSKSFLEAVSPQIAIYSSGSASKYGLPEKVTLERVRKLGIKIFGTDKNGSIFVTSNLDGYTIETSRDNKK